MLYIRGGQTFLHTGQIQKIKTSAGSTYKAILIFKPKKIPIFLQNGVEEFASGATKMFGGPGFGHVCYI
jgi:hypothetical protein